MTQVKKITFNLNHFKKILLFAGLALISYFEHTLGNRKNHKIFIYQLHMEAVCSLWKVYMF